MVSISNGGTLTGDAGVQVARVEVVGVEVGKRRCCRRVIWKYLRRSRKRLGEKRLEEVVKGWRNGSCRSWRL